MITIIVLLSFAVVVLVVLVALLILHNMHQGKELRQKNDVIVHEVRALWRICASPPTTWTWRMLVTIYGVVGMNMKRRTPVWQQSVTLHQFYTVFHGRNFPIMFVNQ